ncbi:MAG: menaquinone biosynthesis protein [Bacteroidia bacterium]|nr:menaquinone biosynthesis protein [Bacteroidia bacterium]
MNIKITAVNFLNTYPFKYGIEKYLSRFSWAEIDYATPAECAKKLMNKTTHIALAPVAVLAMNPNLQIVTNYCLSTNDYVHSVKLYSKKEWHQIQSVVLDYQSLSSVSLVKVLMKYHWNKEVKYIEGYQGFEDHLNADAMVVIGDRTFELNGKFDYEYDLAHEWYSFYGKPFVFAAWITNMMLDKEVIHHLNAAFEYGITHIDDVIADAVKNTDILKFINGIKRQQTIEHYLKYNMQYIFNKERKQSLNHFLNLLKTIVAEDIQSI